MRRCKYYSCKFVNDIPSCSFKTLLGTKRIVITWEEHKKVKVRCKGNIHKCEAVKEIFRYLDEVCEERDNANRKMSKVKDAFEKIIGD